MTHYGPTFVWRPHTDRYEHEKFSSNFIQWFLREPALLEAILAAARRQLALETGTENEGSLTIGTMHHYGAAVASLRRRLSDTTAVYDDAVFWTIIALIVNDQEMQDWESFEVHLSGLRRIVTLRGGPDALKAHCNRAFVLYSWTEVCFANHQDSIALASPGRTRSDSSDSSISSLSSEIVDYTQHFPAGFRRMIEEYDFEITTVVLIDRALQWFRAHMAAVEADNLAASPNDVRTELADSIYCTIHKPDLSKQERLVCVGLYALVVSMNPNYMHQHWSGSMNWYLLRPVNYDDDMMQWCEDCVLWVGLIIASMQGGFSLSQAERWAMLRRVFQKHGYSRTWSEVRSAVQQFCITDALDEQWEACWRFATRKLPQKG